MDGIEHWRQWVGRSETNEDVVTARKIQAFNATLGGDLSLPQPGDPAPPAFHWCLGSRIAAMADIGADGHPARGDFLPPIALPRRMWAGGELELLAPLRVGDVITRLSRIAGIDSKDGRSGTLCFVTVTHEISVSGDIRIRERQDIVYRGEAAAGTARPAILEASPGAFAAQQMIDPSPVLLFRYSALTFNSHRIHYDLDYATRVEGYPGLVVQGPLQATLLLHHATRIAGKPPTRFIYRAVAPLFAEGHFWIRSATLKDRRLSCWSGSENTPVAMKGQVV